MHGIRSLGALLGLLATASAAPKPECKPKYLITFGDSYSQTGFNISEAMPSAASPLGNPALPGWTASGGLNWVGFLTAVLNTTLTLTYNFAYGGATTSAALVTPFEPTVLSFVDQVTEFTELFGKPGSFTPEKVWSSDDTLVGVWMGVNDVGNSFWLSNETTIISDIMDVYFGNLKTVYDAGARNFVLLSVPPTYETPLFLADDNTTRAELKQAITEYNAALSARLQKFAAENYGVVGKIVNTEVPFDDAINDPQKYGAPNATCYDSDGTTCLWFNDYHPGIAINKLVAEAIAAEWKGSFF